MSSVDLQPTLLEMREQRLGLVQTADQLRFSYIAILQGALQDMGLEPSDYTELESEEGNEDSDEDEDEDEDDKIEESDSKFGQMHVKTWREGEGLSPLLTALA